MAVIFVMLIPTVITSAVSLDRAAVAIIETTRINAVATAKAKVAYAQDYFNRAMTDALTLTQSRSVNNYINSAMQDSTFHDTVGASFVAFLTVNPQYLSVAVFDTTMRDRVHVVNQGGKTVLLKDMPSDQPVDPGDYQLATIDGMRRIYISPVTLVTADIAEEAPVINYYMALYSTDNQLRGVFRLTLLLKTVFRDLSDSFGDQVYVVDQSGKFLVHPDPTHTLSGLSPASYSFASELPSLYQLTESSMMGQLEEGNYIETFTHLQPPRQTAVRWTVLYRKPIEPIVADIRAAQLVIIIITVLALTAAVCISLLLTRNLVAPLQMLARAAGEITRGNMFTQIPPPRTVDEVGQLTEAFREMIGALNVSYTSLQKRTLDLEAANAKAYEAVRAKGEFLANVSHELRTPLNAIIGFSDMLLSNMVGPLTERQRHKLQRLNENGARLLTLIDELLEVSRMESGRVEIVERPFNPRLLLERIGAQMESLAQKANLVLLLQVPLDFPEVIYGDERRIEQILVNLLSNAFKFTANGRVDVTLSADSSAQMWSFAVRDTGIGIPAHAKQLIFEEFRQLDSGYARTYKGAGLGLSITQRLVTAMRGVIRVDSQVGEGSTFTVTLPLRVVTEPDAAPTSIIPSDTRMTSASGV
jgi:signal transduction histidine kinase